VTTPKALRHSKFGIVAVIGAAVMLGCHRVRCAENGHQNRTVVNHDQGFRQGWCWTIGG